MQQRVALARCLANDPDVILMDEPLGAFDALTWEKMPGLILRLWKETGKTIILITHSVGLRWMMIMTASRFQNTDVVIMGIILIGVIGFAIDIVRMAECALLPWKGKG